MTQPAKAQEPSMEEILASIRRIIADEEAVKPQTRAAPEPTPGRAAGGSESPGASEPAERRAPAQPVEPDEIETRPAASVAQETSDPEPEFGASDLAETMPASDADEAAFSDIDAHANDDFEDAPATLEHASRPAGGHLRTIEAPEPLLSAEATAAPESGRAAGPGRDRARVPRSPGLKAARAPQSAEPAEPVGGARNSCKHDRTLTAARPPGLLPGLRQSAA